MINHFERNVLLTIHPEVGELSIKNIYGELTLSDLQEAVGGYIESCAPAELAAVNIAMLCDEEGLLKGLPPNKNMYPFFYVGNVTFAAVHGEDLVPLTLDEAEWICEWVQHLGEV